jgi:hypothetical protein
MATVIQIDTHAPTDWLATLLGVGAELAEPSPGVAWLRIPAGNAASESRIAAAAGPRFELVADGWLVRRGDKVATRRLDSSLNWQPLDQVLTLALPVAALAGTIGAAAKTTLQLVRGGQPAPPVAAILPLSALVAWARSASEVRLRRLRWVARENEALVLGNPLPPIDGVALIEKQKILIPAGFQWSPAVPAKDVRAVLAAGEDQWILWQRRGEWSVIPDDAFAAMRRASIKRFRYDAISESSR